jgi:hypothetical protein
MSNATVINTLVAKLAAKIEWAMTELEMTYAEAKAYVSKSSVAGPAVWEILDARY